MLTNILKNIHEEDLCTPLFFEYTKFDENISGFS